MGQCTIAEPHEGIAVCLSTRHAGGNVLLCSQRDVRLEFGIDLAIEPRAADEIGDSVQQRDCETPVRRTSMRRARPSPIDRSSRLLQLLAALIRELVVLHLTIGFGHRPFTRDPAGVLHAVQSPVERALTAVAPDQTGFDSKFGSSGEAGDVPGCYVPRSS